jgi:hypothetical protein
MTRTSLFLLIPISFIYANQVIVDASTEEVAPYSREALIDAVEKVDQAREKAEQELKMKAQEIYRSRDGVEHNITVARSAIDLEVAEVSNKVDINRDDEIKTTQQDIQSKSVEKPESTVTITIKSVEKALQEKRENKQPIIAQATKVEVKPETPVQIETTVVKEVLKVTILDDNLNDEEINEEPQEQTTHYPTTLVIVSE